MTRRDAVKAWCARWRNLRAWGRPLEELDVSVRLRSEEIGDYSTGRCWAAMRRVVVTAGADMPDALATILHEYAHAAVPAGDGHDERWQEMFAASVHEVTGMSIAAPVEDFKNVDREATAAVRAWWRASGNAFAFKLLHVND